MGSKGALVINYLDPQEDLLKAGKIPTGGKWDVPTKSKTLIYRGDEVEEIVGEDGNYAIFYSLVAGAIAGTNPWPISNDDALLVAKIIDQARNNALHV